LRRIVPLPSILLTSTFQESSISVRGVTGGYIHPAAQAVPPAGWCAWSAKDGRVAPFLLFVVFNVVEGMTADRSARLLRSVGRSLKVASPTASGDRPQRELEAVPCVVIRLRTGSRRKICRSVRAEVHRRPSALR
jgi:hypothetical protein